MNICKAEFVSESRAKQAMITLHDVKAIRFGSAVVWLSSIQNKTDVTNIMFDFRGEEAEPTREDEKLLMEIL